MSEMNTVILKKNDNMVYAFDASHRAYPALVERCLVGDRSTTTCKMGRESR